MPNCPTCNHLNPDAARFCARCGGQFSAAPAAGIDLKPGAALCQGRYRIDRQLGEGGMGTVFAATDTQLSRAVALKVLNPDLTRHPTARRRMEQEARALARVDHANVVQVRNIFMEGDLLVLELELVTGGDLASLVRAGGMSPEAAVRVLVPVLDGLHALHEAGLVHRDVKPGNVLLTATGAPKVTDLGVARDSQAREHTKLGAVLGTIDYMSPEQIQGGAVDRRSDVYSAGVMAYEMLSGRKPFEGKSEFDVSTAHVQAAPDLAVLAERCPRALVEVVARALAKQPSARFQTTREMAAALEASIGVTQPSPSAGASSAPQAAVAAPVAAPPQRAPDLPAPPAAPRKSAAGVVVGAIIGLVLLTVVGVKLLMDASAIQDVPVPEVEGPTATPTSVQPAAQVPGSPPAPATVVPWRTGARYVYRYRVDSTASADELLARDHFIERRIENVTPHFDGTVHVEVQETGGPDADVRKFTEIYAATGIGDLRGGANVRAGFTGAREKWQVPGGAAEDVAVAVGPTVRILLHPQLGKVFEQATDDRGSVRTLDLVAFDVAGRTGGDLATPIVRCQWFESKGSKSWLKVPGDVRALPLPGASHAFSSGIAVRRASEDTASVLTLSGGETSHVLSFAADLLVVKAWGPPEGAMAWVVSVWRTPASTCLVLSRLTLLGAADTTYCHGSVDVRDLTDDHFLHMVQQGSTCVAALGVRQGGGRLAARYTLPTTDHSARLSGGWSENGGSLTPMEP